jgi:hypothetical protein
MKKILFCLLIISQFSFSQENKKVETYNFGHNGMEFVARSSKGTVIISTFNSKMTIREDIASIVYDLYMANKLETDKTVTINGCEANVTGKCIIRKKDKLTVVDFYYEIIEWNSGLTEIYKKNLG